MDSNYNLGVIRELLTEAFNAGEVSTLAFDLFHSVYDDFAAGMSKSQMVEAIVDHAHRKGEIPQLLAYARQKNRHQYDRFARRLGAPAEAAPIINSPASAAGAGAGRPSVFISYSHQDEAWKDRLVTHLNVLSHQGLLETWNDRRIGAGEDWYQQIQGAMDQARVAILLVSANFLTSDFILRQEVPRLLERQKDEGTHIFPVIVRPCAWQTVPWLSRLQARPKDGRPLSAGSEHQIDEELAAIAVEVMKLLPE